MRRFALAMTLGVLVASGCLCSDIPDVSQNFVDAGAVDSGTDSGFGDAGDSGAMDSGAADAGPADSGQRDAGSVDAGPDCLPDAGSLPAPLAYWAFNEGSGTTVHDSSGRGNEGVFAQLASGAPAPVWTQAVYCGGLALDGDGGFVDFGMADAGDLDLTGSMTVAAWVKVGTLNPDMSDMPILSKRGVPDRGWELYLDSSDGSVVFDVAVDAPNYVRLYGSGSIADGGWHHLVGVFDAAGQTLQTYVDGVGTFLDAGVPAQQYNSGNPVHLGVQGSCVTAPCTRVFNGVIDEVRVWDVALTPGQVPLIP